MSQTSSPRQFGLGTMLVFIVALSIPLAWVASSLHQVQSRKRMIIDYARRGAGFGESDHPRRHAPLLWRLMEGSDHIFDVELPSDKFTDADRKRLQALFPELDVVIVDRAPWLGVSKNAIDYAETH